MRARDGDDVLKGLEGGLKDSNKREQRSDAPSTVYLFVFTRRWNENHEQVL